MLNNCSQGTFVKDEIIEALGITGADTGADKEKTLNGEIPQMTNVVENLKVVGSLGNPKSIKLPRAYIKQELPVNEQEIATPEKVKRWNYLEGIVNGIFLNTDISVGLLNDANFAEVLEPKEVISSRERERERVTDLYAVKAILSWSISCTSESGDKVSCNRV